MINYWQIILIFIFFEIIIYGLYTNLSYIRNYLYPSPSYADLKLGLCDISEPYVYPQVVPNFITEEEADYILGLCKDDMEDSTTVSGKHENIRKSKTKFMDREDPVIKSIIERASSIVNCPTKNAEPPQVVMYTPGEYYKPHYDSCPDKNEKGVRFVKLSGQRLISVIIYLSEKYSGGETNFVHIKKYKLSKCSMLWFNNMDKKVLLTHPLSLHEGEEVKKGKKEIMNIWFREKEYIS
jgi:prolyl 4-hydroxylase